MRRYFLIFIGLLVFSCDEILDQPADFYVEGINDLSNEVGKQLTLDLNVLSEDENPEIVFLEIMNLPENSTFEFSNESGSTNFNSTLSIVINTPGIFQLEIMAKSGNESKSYPFTVEITEIILNDQQKAAMSLLIGSPWNILSVISKPSADVDVTELLNLNLSFGVFGSGSETAPGAFSASGAPNFITTSSASWNWIGSGTNNISISGASISQFTNVSFSPNIDEPTKITLSFTIQNTGGRTQGIVGDYTIELQ